MSNKIEIDSYGNCCDEKCVFKRECSQHRTAGDFRAEDGFRPDIKFILDEGFCCFTKNVHPYITSLNECLPTGFESMSAGALTNGDLKSIRQNAIDNKPETEYKKNMTTIANITLTAEDVYNIIRERFEEKGYAVNTVKANISETCVGYGPNETYQKNFNGIDVNVALKMD